MNLYSKNTAGNHQGLLIDEATGHTVALAYDANEATELARRWNEYEDMKAEIERLRECLVRFVRLCPSPEGLGGHGPQGAFNIAADYARAALAAAKGGAA